MVKYATRVMGMKVEGVLTTPPPAGPDAFPVRAGPSGVEVESLP
jgi:hypothetical protein